MDTPDEAQAAGLAARRRLLQGGTVITEWRRSADGDGSVESELHTGELVAERRYDAAGRLFEELHFAAGDLLRRAVLTYSGGRLRRIQRYDGAGTLTATENYELTSSGRLRGFSHIRRPVRRQPAQQVLWRTPRSIFCSTAESWSRNAGAPATRR